MSKYILLSSIINNKDIDNIVKNILDMTRSLKKYYPEYESWFINKHIPGIYLGTRDAILLMINNDIVGICNIKYEENKICTLFIKEEYQNKGMVKELIEEAIILLKVTDPLLTIPKSVIYKYESIIKKYNWKLIQSIDNYYVEGSTELVYNRNIDGGKTWK